MQQTERERTFPGGQQHYLLCCCSSLAHTPQGTLRSSRSILRLLVSLFSAMANANNVLLLVAQLETLSPSPSLKLLIASQRDEGTKRKTKSKRDWRVKQRANSLINETSSVVSAVEREKDKSSINTCTRKGVVVIPTWSWLKRLMPTKLRQIAIPL